MSFARAGGMEAGVEAVNAPLDLGVVMEAVEEDIVRGREPFNVGLKSESRGETSVTRIEQS